MTLIYNAFRCLPPNPHNIAPYFNGYLGSHVSVWPDFRQLRGLVSTASANPRPCIRLVHRRRTLSARGTATTTRGSASHHGHRRVSTRLPLGQEQDVVVMNRLTAYETGLLADLSGETGVSIWDWDGLFERCGHCGKYFVARVLRMHIPSRTVERERSYRSYCQ